MKYFDFEKAASQAHISHDKLNALAKKVRLEFPNDQMMLELHLMRICMAVQAGHVSIDQALDSQQAA